MPVVDGKCKITLNAVDFEGLLSSVPDHSAAHEYGGSDVIKIDDLGAPDDNTDLNASTSKHGLCPKGTGTGTKYLKDDLTWGTPEGTGGVTFGTTAGTACEGNDSRLSDARTPDDHAASHASGGTDTIKIDDLGAADDNTDLNASTSAHGLCPKGTNTGKYLKDDITWTTISIDGGTPATAVNTIQFRRATSAQLANGNPVLAAGEPAFETDTFVFKIGNGVTAYNSLPPLNLTSGTPTAGSGYRKAIIINHSYVTCDLTNFPVLVKIVDDTELGAHAKPDGYDVRFVLNNNTNLDYERVSWNITDGKCNAIFWVRLPSVTCLTDTTFFIKYGSETVDGANPTGTWDSYYDRVYHLEELGNGSAGEYKDSTSNHADSIVSTNPEYPVTNPPARAAALVGYGQNFNGTDDLIYLQLPALSVDGNFTISWTGKGTGGGVMGGFGPSKIITMDTFFGIYGIYNSTARQYTVSPTNFAPTAAFHRYTIVKQSSTLFFYMDGEFIAFLDCDIDTKLSLAAIGYNVYWGEFYTGILDEIFISNTNRPAEWVYAEAINMNTPESFLTFGAETTY